MGNLTHAQIRITISAEAYTAIAATLPGNVGK
jgi:hypothetical protein